MFTLLIYHAVVVVVVVVLLHYFYKTQEGFTQSFPFFSIPRINKKLNVMGPGEALVDTDLIGLADEINVTKNKEEEEQQQPHDKSIA